MLLASYSCSTVIETIWIEDQNCQIFMGLTMIQNKESMIYEEGNEENNI